MSKRKKNPNANAVTMELCEAYRKDLTNQIKGLKDDIDGISNRQWATLVSVILTIITVILTAIIQ